LGLFRRNCVLFNSAWKVLSRIICWGENCTFQDTKQLTIRFAFIVSLLAAYLIKRETDPAEYLLIAGEINNTLNWTLCSLKIWTFFLVKFTTLQSLEV
jgi:hypothetical protein